MENSLVYMPSTRRSNLQIGDVVIVLGDKIRYVVHVSTDTDKIGQFPAICYAFRVKRVKEPPQRKHSLYEDIF